ncbi:cytochrome c3 family protein [Thermincola ferriacetica]
MAMVTITPIRVGKKRSRYGIKATVIALAVILAVFGAVFSFFFGEGREVRAGVTAPKILIISNDDTYLPSSYSKGTSATNMQSFLQGQGFVVDVHSEKLNGAVNANFVTIADNYDLVIFTQGVGYRSTSNNAPGLDGNDIAFLKEYLNLTNTVPGTSKANLIIEGEDILYDMGRSGTSTDQRDILEINTSSSRGDRGRITELRVLDTNHPVNQGLASSATTSYQTNWQDSLVATTGAKIITNSIIGGNTYGAINTYDDGKGNRRVFMPFAWYANNNNRINDQTWREMLLLNAVKWVGERKVTVTSTNLAPADVMPGATQEMLKVTLTAAWGDPGISGLTINETGSAMAASAIAKVMVYDDANNNGVIDTGEQKLGETTTWTGESATVNFSSPLAVADGTSKNLIVAYQLNSGNVGTTVGASLADSNAIILYAQDILAKTYGTFPQSSGNTLITSAGTAQIISPSNNATIHGSYNVIGVTSGEYYLEYSPGYNSTGPWTQINYGPTAVNHTSVGTWDTTGVTDGAYTLRLRVTTGTEATVNVTVDNTAPTVTSGPSVSVGSTTATVTWTTDESSTSEVVYKPFSSGTWSTITSSAYVLNHSVQLTGLNSATQYDFYIKSTDATGNTVTTPTQNFTTEQLGAIATITSPAIVGEVIPRVGGIVDITGTARTDRPGGRVQWSVYYGAGTSRNSVTTWNLLHNSTTPVTNGTLYSWDTNSLANGSYVLKLVTVDPDLTGSTASMEAYVEVIVDNTPPVISNVHVISVSNISADIAWSVNKSTNGQVSYGKSPGAYSNTVQDDNNDNQVFLSGLTPNTTYYFRVTVNDTAGHVVNSGEYTFTTSNVNDATVPATVYNLRATGRTDTTVDLAWSAAVDNTGISSYNIYRSIDGTNFTKVATKSGAVTHYTDTGLNASTEYWYRATATDLAGNESLPSESIKVPTVAQFRVNPHGSYPKLTNMCSKCHTTHRGKKSMLFNDTQEQKVCFSCHNGTGSKYDIQNEYNVDPNNPDKSRHPLPMSHTQKECASCHNPHLSDSGTPSLLAAAQYDANGNLIGYASSGNQFCYACHGDVEVSKVIYAIGGSHAPFENSVHNGSNFPLPESGSKIKCVMCHNNHASPYVRLTKAKEEENCYHCHGDTANSGTYGLTVNIKSLFQKSSHHKVESNGANDTRVECVNCHNPHYITKTNIVSNPYDTNDNWNWSVTPEKSKFCIQCHDGDAPPAKMVNDTTVVPYSVYFPAFSNQTTADYSGPNGSWNKSGFTAYGHYNAGVQCTNCHDPHGSDNSWMLKYPEDPNSTPGSTSGVCLRCHGGGATPAGPDVWTNGFSQSNSHPTLAMTGKHSNTENYSSISIADRHAECYDCHDPHSVKSTPTGNLAGALNNVSGVTRSGGSLVWKQKATEEWEICYKCHSSYWNNLSAAGKRDIAAEFYRTTGTYSYHYVELSNNPNLDTTRVNAHLINGWTATSKMKCTDCHGSPTGAKGPHGSPYPNILKGSYDTSINTRTGLPSDFICFRCHEENYYKTQHMNNKSDHMQVSCKRCHGTRFHGSNRAHFIAVNNGTGPDVDPESYLNSGTYAHPQYNSKSSCSSTVSQCSDH